jgi:hypothetical protein
MAVGGNDKAEGNNPDPASGNFLLGTRITAIITIWTFFARAAYTANAVGDDKTTARLLGVNGCIKCERCCSQATRHKDGQHQPA